MRQVLTTLAIVAAAVLLALWLADAASAERPDRPRVLQVVASPELSCALTEAGRAICWPFDVFTDGELFPETEYVAVDVDRQYACAVRADGGANCVETWDDAYGGPPRVDDPSVIRSTESVDGDFISISVDNLDPTWDGGMTRYSSCGLTRDQRIRCQHRDRDDAMLLSGRFTAVDHDAEVVCGIRTDASLACAGAAWARAVPVGAFQALSVTSVVACALDLDGRIHCWGAAQRDQADGLVWVPALLDPPDGAFRSLSIQRNFACAVRHDDALVCWGGVPAEVTLGAGGDYRSVSTARGHVCAVAVDARVACWGIVWPDWSKQPSSHSPPQPPNGERWSPVKRTSGPPWIDRGRCQLADDGAVACRWYSQGTPMGRYAALVGASGYRTERWCALSSAGQATCWGSTGDRPATDPPNLRYRSMELPDNYGCGLTTDGAIACWGDNSDGQADAPPGRHQSVSVGPRHACALNLDGRVACWGDNSDGQTDVPEGRFTRIGAAGSVASHSCALAADGEMRCWGLTNFGYPFNPAWGRFVDITVGPQSACGLRRDGGIVCSTYQGQEYWSGTYDSIYRAGTHVCGARRSGGTTCRDVEYPHGYGGASTSLLDFTVLSSGADIRSRTTIPAADRAAGVAPVRGAMAVRRLADGRAEVAFRTSDGRLILPQPSIALEYDLPEWLDPRNTSSRVLWTSGPIVVDGQRLGRIVASGPIGRRAPQFTFRFQSVNGDRIPVGGSLLSGSAPVGVWLESAEFEVSRRIVDVAVSGGTSCRLDAAGVINCSWGGSWAFVEPQRYGWRYTDLLNARCARTVADTIHCVSYVSWGMWPGYRLITNHGEGLDLASNTLQTCVLRLNREIECDRGPAPPEGRHDSLSAADRHMCAISVEPETRGSLRCWGDQRDAPSPSPTESYLSVSASGRNTCAITDGIEREAVGRVVCWGDDEHGLTSHPDGLFLAVSVGEDFACALTDASRIVCWGRADERDGVLDAPSGRFTSLSVQGGYSRHGCAIEANGSAVCWGAGQACPGLGHGHVWRLTYERPTIARCD